MFAQFHSRYPAGSLVSELLQIYDGNFVVRTLIQVGGVTLASGFAAATVIEEAEDHARIRALAVLGITPEPYESQVKLLDHDAKLDQAQLSPARAMGLSDHYPDNRGHRQAYGNPSWEEEAASEEEFLAAYRPPLEMSSPVAHPNPSQSRRRPEIGPPLGRGGRNSPKSSPLPGLDDGPLDLSDIIAQTSVEMKRLGWTDSHGRTYLQRTYNKRSRQQLTDEELLDFLHYLQAEPSPGEPSF